MGQQVRPACLEQIQVGDWLLLKDIRVCVYASYCAEGRRCTWCAHARYFVQEGERRSTPGSGELAQEQDFAQPSGGSEYIHSLVDAHEHMGYEEPQQQHPEDVHVMEFGAGIGKQEDDAHQELRPHPKRRRSLRSGAV